MHFVWWRSDTEGRDVPLTGEGKTLKAQHSRAICWIAGRMRGRVGMLRLEGAGYVSGRGFNPRRAVRATLVLRPTVLALSRRELHRIPGAVLTGWAYARGLSDYGKRHPLGTGSKPRQA